MELRLAGGLTATATPATVTVPKNTPSGVRISIRSGSSDLTATQAAQLLGGTVAVEGELSGPGLRAPLHLPSQLPAPGADPFLLALPALPVAGDYTLANLRITANGSTAIDVTPQKVAVTVIDQVLITSVTTRALTLDEIREKGIILDSNSYLGFEFTLGLSLDSKTTQFSFPVVFDKRGVALPQPIRPPSEPERATMPPLTTIVPMLLKPPGDLPEATVRLPNGETVEVRIPSVLVIPGNVGYLKQFFSAKLFVANGAPGTSNLTVHDVTGRIKLPPGADRIVSTLDDPLMLPDTTKGPQPSTLPVRAAGPDGKAGTTDDVGTFSPGEQGEAEFLIRGEKEGFHLLDFDVEATLEGLVTGPVKVTGSGQGGVLVRNPYFDMTFTAPAVVRTGEQFTLFVTVNNISQSLANAVTVTLDGSRLSGAHLVSSGTQVIDTLAPRDSRVLEFQFQADRTGQLVATYLNFDTQNGTTGNLKFTLGVGERGVPLSPDTLVLPAATNFVPSSVLSAAMRVLGQAWSVSNAPSGSLPPGVVRTSREVVTLKALALAEAGLRISLGQPSSDAIRDLLFDFHGGSPIDSGFDQILRTTNAGTELARAIGNALRPTSETAGGAAEYERQAAQIAASGTDFVTFAVGNVTGAPVNITLHDGEGRKSATDSTSPTFVKGEVPSAVIVPFGTNATASRLGLIAAPFAAPYKLEMTGTGSATVDISVTIPNGSGAFIHATASGVPVSAGAKYSLGLDPRNALVLQIDADGNGQYESSRPLASQTMFAQGPRLVSATVIGPETLAGAAPFGFHTAVLFDRIVDAASAANAKSYTIAKNSVLSAKRQLSGRLVFLNLEQPEGPYVPTQLSVNAISDPRRVIGPGSTTPLRSRVSEIGAVVTGRVLGSDGAPVRNLPITYAQNAELTCAPPLDEISGLTNVRTDDTGRFELRYVRQDTCGVPFYISTRDPNTGALRSLSSSVRASGEQIVMDIALFGRGSVTGTVKSLTGAPVTGAHVIAMSQTDPQSSGSATSDSSGRYRIDNIVVGAISVHAVLGASLGRSNGRIDNAGAVAVVNLTLDGGTVKASGIVRRVQGSTVTVVPAQQVVYYAKGSDGSFLPIALDTTDSNGAFSFTGMPTGEYRIEAPLNSRDKGSVTGIAAAGDVLTRDIAIVIGADGYGTVRGIVKFPDGTVAAGVIVSIDDRGVLSGGDGSFELPGIVVKPAQTQRILARSRDGLRAGQSSVLIAQPNQLITNVVVILSGIGSAEFTVLDASRNPVADQEVALLGGCDNPCGCAALKTNSAGKVRFEGLPLGSVTARATRTNGSFIDQTQTTATLQSDGAIAFGVMQFSGSGTVTGTVLNPDGSPSLGADVRLYGKVFNEDYCSLVDGFSQRVRTDTAGKFRFTSVNAGSISVNASHSFYTTNIGGSATISKQGDVVDFTLRLTNTISGVLSGTVYLPDGKTVAGPGVEVTAVGPLPNVVVMTDANGRYQFAKIFPEGTYNVTARDAATGTVRRNQVYLRASQDLTHDMRLKGRGTVTVKVVNGAGQPVSTSAFVRLQESEYPNSTYEAALETANNGIATFINVFEGPLTVTASDAFARGGRASSVLSAAGATLDMTVAMTTTGTVKGHFYKADGVTPIAFGTVRLIVNGAAAGQSTTNGTNDVGAFTFSYVPAGAVRIEAQDPQTARAGVAAGSLSSESEVVTLNVKAQGLGRVQGLVTSNGAPQPGAQVVISAGAYRASTIADAAGRYLIEGVPEGLVVASASLSGNFLSGSNSGILTGEASTLTVDVSLRDSGKITGKVLAADGISAAALSYVTATSGGATLSTTSDTQGNFAFDRVPTGLASLNASVLGGIDKGSASTDVAANATATVTVKLNGIGSITGKALDSAGQPIAGDITVTGSGAFPYSFTVQSQVDGTFALPQVLAGPFTATLRAKSGEFFLYGTAIGHVPPGQTANVNVQVQPSGTVTGLVMRSNGTTPAVGANIVLQLNPNRGTVAIQAGTDGRFTARGVPLGAFAVNVNDPITNGLARSQGSLTNNGDTADLGTIVVDDQPLTVLSITPPNGSTGVATTTPIVLTFSNALSSTAGISVLNGSSPVGAAASLASDAKTVTLNGTWPDSKEITVSVSTSVTDIFGRRPLAGTTSKFRTVDLSPPAVATVAPAHGSIQVEPSTAITITFNEPLLANGDVTTVVTLSAPSGAIAGTTALSAPAAIAFTPSAPLPANATFIVNVNGATDASGNKQTAAFTSTFATTDTVSPIVTIAAPQPDAWIRNARPAVQVNATDAVSGVAPATAALALDGAAVTASFAAGAIYYTPQSDLAQGTHTVDASIADRAGNRASASSSFRIDTVAPAIPVISGISSGQTVRGQISLGASSDDATSGVVKIEILSDGGVVATLAAPAFSTNYDTNSLPEGPHAFAARATDAAGNVSAVAAAITAVVDNRPLTVSFTAPAQNTPVRDAVSVSASGSEPLLRIEFTAAGQTVTDDSSPYHATFNMTATTDGAQVVTATAYALSGETAQATRTVVVDRTAPAPPDAARISAEPPQNASSLVYAYAGAVEPNVTVEITNTTHPATTTVRAVSDGSFSIYIAARVDDMLSVVAIDSVGNRSEATLVPVRSTPSLPPSQGSTSLRYDGLLVDRISSTGLSPDGNLDAVFTLSLKIGDSATRTISYIDLNGPSGLRTTRSSLIPLGVAQDAGGALLNHPTYTVDFPVTSGTTLTLFGADNGFIQDGATYTVTAVFKDGSRFVDTYFIVPKDDRARVAHSADVAASPATVAVPSGGAATTAITVTNIRDIENTLVPDGSKIAISAADMAAKDPLGGAIRSTGGTITDGAVAANNPNFRIFTISGGSVRATYSSAPVTPAAKTGAHAVVQIQAADASGNVLGTEAVATIEVLVRSASDQAIVHVTPSTIYADKSDRRAHLRVEVRDSAGRPAADGTKVIVTAVSNTAIVGCCYLGSIGGTVLGGTPSPQNSGWRVFTVSGGVVDADYSAVGMSAVVGEVKGALVTVVPADANGNRASTDPLGTGVVYLVGAGHTEVTVTPETVPYVFPLPTPVAVDVHHAHDARAHLLPDGATLLVSASSGSTYAGCCYIGSFGGTILDGTPSPNASSMKYFPLLRNAFRATYSIQGVGTVNSGEVQIANIQVAAGDMSGARLDQRNVGLAQVKILGPLNSIGSVSPGTIFGDGNLVTTNVRFSHILDTYGNPLPEGSKVVVSSANGAAYAGCCYLSSAGGQILNGTPSPTASWKTFAITNGVVDVVYGNQGLSPGPGQTLTANVMLAQSGANGERLSQMALGAVPISIVGTNSAQASASPSAFYADGADVRSTVTIANIRDLKGNAVPDGTLIGVSVTNGATYAGCCYISSVGGVVVGDRVATNNANFKVFTVTNGQLVVQYSAQGVAASSAERVATVQVVAANSAGAILSNQAIASVPIRLLPQGSATVIASPVNVTALAPNATSQITISNMKSTDGAPLPDGTRVALSVVNGASISGCCYVSSVGGTLTPAGTTAGDGTTSPNNGNFKWYTIAGGQVKAVYDAANISAGVGETKIATVQVLAADRNGNTLSQTAMGIATVRINGVTSTTASGPASMTMGETATVSFAGFKDAAGNAVPDGTPVAVSVTNSATYTGCCYNASAGGTILNGTASTNGNFKVFTTTGGAISVDYTTTGVVVNPPTTVRFQVVPVQSNLTPILSSTLTGGMWPLTLYAPVKTCGEGQCVPSQGMYVSHFSAPDCGGTESYYLPYDGFAFMCRTWDGGAQCGVVRRTVTNYSARINGGACQNLWPGGNTLNDFVTIYR